MNQPSRGLTRQRFGVRRLCAALSRAGAQKAPQRRTHSKTFGTTGTGSWRVLLLLLWVFCRTLSLAQQLPPVAIPGIENAHHSGSTNELRDVWPGIAAATNLWAEAVRKKEGWNEVLGATLSETRAMAEKGLALAQLRLGYSYFAGDGLEQDYGAAGQWLLKAAASGLAPANFLLGVAYLNGLGVKRDFSEAVDQLNLAADQGFADAEFQLGLCYLRGGPGVNQAPARGVKWLTRAAEQGKPAGQQFLAWCYSSGTGVPEDPAEAFKWCSRAAGQGLDTAQDFLGMFYAAGYGTNKDWSQAAKWFRLAAAQGLGTAQLHLAECYTRGRGAEKDPAQALAWWRPAAEQGFPTAQFHVGLASFEGSGTPSDAAAAVKWFRRAAEQRHIGGQLFLGLCYWKGSGVNPDPDKAQKWWREAAIHGITVGLAELGDEKPEVEQWWRQVAEQGNARIQCCLAEFYRFGQGTPQNEAEAIKWYRKAIDKQDLAALQAAAWMLATNPKAELRDGRSAVEFARKAAALTKRKDPKSLDTLAAAYAEAAQFGKAVSAQKEAIALVQDEDDKKVYESRLRQYQGKFAYRAPPELPPPQ